MSSPPKEKIETKAGHPPAVKAGGMRIVRKHQGSTEVAHEKDKDSEEYESCSPPKPTVIVSGVITKGDKDFTPSSCPGCSPETPALGGEAAPGIPMQPSHPPAPQVSPPCPPAAPPTLSRDHTNIPPTLRLPRRTSHNADQGEPAQHIPRKCTLALRSRRTNRLSRFHCSFALLIVQ